MFRFYSSPTSPVRVAIVGVFSEGSLKLAAARTSKKDQFIRKKGRLIAEGRLAKGKLLADIPMANCDIQQFLGIAKELSINVIKSKRVLA